MGPPKRFFLTNSNPPPESPVIPPQNHSASVCINSGGGLGSNFNSPKHIPSDGDSSGSGLYSPSFSPYFMRDGGPGGNTGIPSSLSSGSTSDDDESLSSWPLSRPPSLAHFDIEEGDSSSIPRIAPGLMYGFGSSSSGSKAEVNPFGDLIDASDGPSGGGGGTTGYSTSDSTNSSKKVVESHVSSTSSTTLPQLVMPRVALPSRKPFTSVGLRLGKLKILIAGDSGIGKTELIKAILESSKHIVHVDEPNRCHIPKDNDLIDSIFNDCNDNDHNEIDDVNSTTATNENVLPASLVEISASTKPYSLYMIAHHEKSLHKKRSSSHDNDDSGNGSDSDLSNGNYGIDNGSSDHNSRRPSLIHSLESATSADGALSRNISFVDTPGYGQYSDTMTCIRTVISYLDNRFRETANMINVSSPQVINLITSASSLSEFSHVDVCFYLILDRIKRVDINYISQLSRYAPVIPLISKSDQLQPDDIVDLKVSILKELKAANVSPFLYDTSIDDAISFGEQLIKERKERRGSGSSNNDRTTEILDNPPFPDRLESVYPLLMPCAVSSHRNPEPEMLASVLMEADYTIELIGSELQDLCRYIFSEHGSAWLRFIAAKKFVEWISTVQVSNSLHSHNILGTNTSLTRSSYHQQQLVPYGNNIPTGTIGSIEILPEFFYSSSSGRAQQHYARWAMQLEQVSRTENVISLRSRQMYRSRRQQRTNNIVDVTTTTSYSVQGDPNSRSNRSTGPTSPTRPDGNISDSILNCDPLSLDKVISKALKYTVGAISFVAGVRALSWLYKTFAAPAPIVQVFIEPKPTENILIAALNSLGGGWSVLV